jgi:hypothetical protein
MALIQYFLQLHQQVVVKVEAISLLLGQMVVLVVVEAVEMALVVELELLIKVWCRWCKRLGGGGGGGAGVAGDTASADNGGNGGGLGVACAAITGSF